MRYRRLIFSSSLIIVPHAARGNLPRLEDFLQIRHHAGAAIFLYCDLQRLTNFSDSLTQGARCYLFALENLKEGEFDRLVINFRMGFRFNPGRNQGGSKPCT